MEHQSRCSVHPAVWLLSASFSDIWCSGSQPGLCGNSRHGRTTPRGGAQRRVVLLIINQAFQSVQGLLKTVVHKYGHSAANQVKRGMLPIFMDEKRCNLMESKQKRNSQLTAMPLPVISKTLSLLSMRIIWITDGGPFHLTWSAVMIATLRRLPRVELLIWFPKFKWQQRPFVWLTVLPLVHWIRFCLFNNENLKLLRSDNSYFVFLLVVFVWASTMLLLGSYFTDQSSPWCSPHRVLCRALRCSLMVNLLICITFVAIWHEIQKKTINQSIQM